MSEDKKSMSIILDNRGEFVQKSGQNDVGVDVINPLLSEAGKAVYVDVTEFAAENGLNHMPRAFMLYGRQMLALAEWLEASNAVVLPEVEEALERWATYLNEKKAQHAIMAQPSKGE